MSGRLLVDEIATTLEGRGDIISGKMLTAGFGGEEPLQELRQGPGWSASFFLESAAGCTSVPLEAVRILNRRMLGFYFRVDWN